MREASADPPALSVIIVSWNAASTIAACLDSLLENAPPRACEIFVIDNASTDDSLRIARQRSGSATAVTPIKIVALEKNKGFAGACNEGHRLARGEYLLFLNSDVVATTEALEKLCQFMDAHPTAAAAGGKLLGTNGVVQKGFNVRAFPTLMSTAFEILMVDKLWPRNPVSRKQRMLDFSHTEIREVDQPAGACLLVRRSAWEKVGPFDESFHPAWFEDVDLCLRMKRNDLTIFFVPDAVFGHRGAASLEHLAYHEFLSYWYKNLLRYFGKNHGRLSTLFLRGLILFGMPARMLVTVFARPKPGVARKEALSAYWRVLRETL